MAHKYHAVATTVDGIRFASRAEARRYGQLKLLQAAGQIKDLRTHPRFELQPKFRRPDGKTVSAITYTADFAYAEGGHEIIEDVKGVETTVWRLKRRMFWRAFPGLELRVVKA